MLEFYFGMKEYVLHGRLDLKSTKICWHHLWSIKAHKSNRIYGAERWSSMDIKLTSSYTCTSPSIYRGQLVELPDNITMHKCCSSVSSFFDSLDHMHRQDCLTMPGMHQESKRYQDNPSTMHATVVRYAHHHAACCGEC